MTTSASSAPASATGLRSLVRDRTQVHHQRLEGRMNLEGSWDLERYKAFLKGTLAVVAPLEPQIAQHLQAYRFGADPGGLAADRLRHDLSALRADDDVPPAATVPAVTDEASAFGAAYVMIGARLGGQIIARTLAADLALTPDQLTYFSPPGLPVGSAWRDFVAALDAYGARTTATEWNAAAESAVATFQAIEQSLDARQALDER